MKKTVLTIILASAGAVCSYANDAVKAELIEVGKKNFMSLTQKPKRQRKSFLQAFQAMVQCRYVITYLLNVV